MKRFRVLTAVLATLTLGACASLGRASFKEPVVNLRDVSVTALGLTGGSLDVTLAVYNPNGYRLDATRLTYRVSMANDVTVGSGQIDTKLTMQEKDTTLVKLPVSFTYAGIGAAGREVMNTGAVDYKVAGEITVGTPVGNFTKPYAGTGRFSPMARTR